MRTAPAAALTLALIIGLATPAAAGPISVFTQVSSAGGGISDEIPVRGLGDFAVLTTGGGVGPTLTLPADQTTARAAVVGYWPVIQFHDRAQYDAQRGTVLTVPSTAVRLYAEVWDGVYGQGFPAARVFVDAVVSARLGTEPGQTAVDWQFPNPPPVVQLPDATVTLTYTPVVQPAGSPSIAFSDGSPPIPGSTGPIYYPTLVELTITAVPTGDAPPPVDPSGDTANTPEPASLLLAGLGLCGVVVRRFPRRGRVTPT